MKNHIHIKRVTAAFLLSTLLLFSAGCDKETPPLRVGTNVWPGYEPLYLADSLGYLDRKRVNLVEFPASSGVIRAIVNRSIDAGALTIDEVFRLIDRDIPVRVVLIFDVSNGGDVILGRSGMKSVSDLKGKRIGVESSALGAYVLHRALSLNNLKLKDVQVENVVASEHERAFNSGEVDIVVTFEPVRRALLNAGAKELFSSKDIPGEIVDVLVVHEDYLRQEGNALRHLIKGWYEAVDYLSKEPKKAASIMEHRLNMPPEEILESFKLLHLPGREETRKLMKGNGKAPMKENLRLMKEMMLSERLITRDISLKNLLDTSYID